MILKKQEDPILVSVWKIWDHASHNALTDLIRYHNSWFVCFRESDKHVHGTNGIIRILTSTEGIIWSPTYLFQLKGMDLRDPKLSLTPDGRLMLLTGGTVFSEENNYVTKQSFVAFSQNGKDWGPLISILQPHDWLWRITWFQGKAYGVVYSFSDRKEEWRTSLVESHDGIHYNIITNWNIPGFPNETTLQFTNDGAMIALVRRDFKEDSRCWIGYSRFPYTDWQWNVAKHYFGGPNFIILPSGRMWAAGRIISSTPYGEIEKTMLARMNLENLFPVMILPSGGDTSYPGMVYYKDYLWLSYYSSHEKKTSIYFAKVQLPT